MLAESKILRENIKTFRTLLTEGIGDAGIIDAIQNHEYVYIYYTGDENNKMGYRTIRPYVLGRTKEGNEVLRAWQDNRKSVSFRSPERRPDHEYWTDDFDKKEKPGWRLFRVDKISSLYPTGNKFVDAEGNVIIPPKYREGSDAQMGGGIIQFVSKGRADVETSGEKSIDEPNVSVQKADKTAIDPDTMKPEEFAGANKAGRKPTALDIEKLYKIAKKVMKRAPGSLFVAIDKNNYFKLKNIRIKDRFKPEMIVGDLMTLYDALVKKEQPTKPEEEKFFNDQERTALQK